ncbi:MAG: pseudouridine synthase [Clostridia bacterium]
MRFDKFVADALGVTRSEARSIIKKGEITVDGNTVTAPAAHIGCEEVRYKGEKITPEEFIYLMMNKPAGYLSATEDRSQKTVLDLLPDSYRRYNIFPAGRLDKDAEGFLLLTNDGRLAHNVLSPKKKVGKKYFVRLERELENDKIDILEKGVDIGGYVTKPCTVEKLDGNCVYITITEGKYHQVKKMFAAAGNHVEYLKRISFAGLDLDESLELGEYRQLCTKELDKILHAIQ